MNFQRDSSCIQQVLNKSILMQTDFRNFPGRADHISLVQERVTHFGTFPQMAALNYCEPDVCCLLYNFPPLLFFGPGAPLLGLAKSIYSQTSHKRPPKMLSLGGRLWEVVTYESLDHSGSKFFLIRIIYGNCRNPCTTAEVVGPDGWKSQK